MEADKLWQATLADLEVSLSRPVFKAWFSQTKALSLEVHGDSQQLTVTCPSTYAKEWIETHYFSHITQIIKTITKAPTSVIFIVGKQKPVSNQSAGPLFDEPAPVSGEGVSQSRAKAQLNPLYTFDNFVVGASNNLAYNAALAVVKAPGRIHNPLFIYGGVGCGKTHLMHSIGNALLMANPERTALYASCEQFTNDLIESLKTKTTEKFRNKYRKLDLLLIDDIQFISKSEYAQEEFFNTFNTLYNINHQIVIASDRLPEEIPKLASRLTSRFQGGVIVDVQPPDLEMRIAILQAKATEYGALLPDEASIFIAQTYRDNTRELEGALKRVIAAAAVKGDPITLEFVKGVLGATKRELKRRITPRQIIESVADTFDISLRELTGTKRRHQIVVARQAAMYLLRERLNLQYERIAELLGGKDHTTIMYGVARVENLVENDVDFRGKIEEVMSSLGKS